MTRQLVALTLTALMHIVCFAIMTERKYSVKKTVSIYFAFLTVFVCFAMLASRVLFDIHSFYATSLTFLSTMLVAFIIFMVTSADPACKKVFLFLSYSSMFCIFFCISAMISSVWFKDDFGIAAVYVKTIIRTLLYLPVIWSYIVFLRPAIREVSGLNKKIWHSISLVSVQFLSVFSIFCFIYTMKNDFRAWYSLLFAATVLIYFSVLWISFGMIRYMIKESRMELIEENMKHLQDRLKTAKENEMSAKTVRHDFRHHNQNIATMLQKGETNEALHYIEQYNESLGAARTKEFCSHVTVNAILSSFYIKAQNDGICISIEADTQEGTNISDMDFVAILSNILENAVNGCKECGAHGKININIRTVSDKTVIVCSNSCKPGLVIENNMIKHRGIGIESMLTAARKYDGDISYRLENDVLTLCVILKK
jgi:hypothetical protein